MNKCVYRASFGLLAMSLGGCASLPFMGGGQSPSPTASASPATTATNNTASPSASPTTGTKSPSPNDPQASPSPNGKKSPLPTPSVQASTAPGIILSTNSEERLLATNNRAGGRPNSKVERNPFSNIPSIPLPGLSESDKKLGKSEDETPQLPKIENQNINVSLLTPPSPPAQWKPQTPIVIKPSPSSTKQSPNTVPTNPINRSNPASPASPANPAIPANRSNPANPASRSNPTSPANRSNPTSRSNPAISATPANPATPVSRSNPASPIRPSLPLPVELPASSAVQVPNLPKLPIQLPGRLSTEKNTPEKAPEIIPAEVAQVPSLPKLPIQLPGRLSPKVNAPEQPPEIIPVGVAQVPQLPNLPIEKEPTQWQGPGFPEVAPPPPDTSIASNIEVSGVLQIDNHRKQIIVKVPTEATSRYVQEGQRLANGEVLVKRIELSDTSNPVVVFEQNGQEVTRTVGDKPAGSQEKS